ncbi:MAG: PDZ domain-containing protein [Calditrichaeota bacterium]|nr:PDZ domain-containing protein [Calditrichota bacterium]
MPAVRGSDDEEAPEFDNLGISLRGLSADEKERYNVTGGLLIESVTTGSPAEKAGVIPFSILVSIDGNNLNTVEEFDHILEYSESGKVLKFKVKEGSRRGEFQLLLVEVP